MASTAQDSSAPLRTEKKDEDVDESTSWSTEWRLFFRVFSLSSLFHCRSRNRCRGRREDGSLFLLLPLPGESNQAREIFRGGRLSISWTLIDSNRARNDAWRGAAEPEAKKKKKTTRWFSSSSSSPPLFRACLLFLLSLLRIRSER